MAEDSLVWQDISDEQRRSYSFPTGTVMVNNPVKLNVKQKQNGDSHRIIDADGNGHYIPVGWLKIYWVVKPGSPAVAF